MTNKIGSVVLLLTCIFISLGFGLLFQNKITLEGYKTKDTIMSNLTESIDAQIRADKMKKMKESNNDYATTINNKSMKKSIKKFKKSMKELKEQLNDEISMKDYNTIIIQCINYIIGLDLRKDLKIDFEDNRKYTLTYMKNFIILPNEPPNEPIDQAPEIIKQLDSILMQTNKKNWEKIKEIKTLVKTFAQK